MYSHWSQGYLTPSWILSICIFRTPTGSIPPFIALMSQSFMFKFNVLLQTTCCSDREQGYLTSSCFLAICLVRLLVEVAENLHLSHGYLNSLCLLLICFFRLLWLVAAYIHRSQGYLSLLCLFTICFFRLL